MKYILATLMASFLAACGLVIPLDLPQKKTRLVVNCLFSPDDFFRVSIGNTAPILGKTRPKTLREAQISIGSNTGETTTDFVLDSTIQIVKNERNPDQMDTTIVYSFRSLTTKPTEQTTYTISATSKGFETPAQATQTVPRHVAINSLQYVGATNTDGLLNFQYAMTFDDVADETNFYGMSVYVKNQTQKLKRGFYSFDLDLATGLTNDPTNWAGDAALGVYYGNIPVFTDKSFRNGSKTIFFSVSNKIFSPNPPLILDVYVELQTHTRASYNYIFSANQQANSNGTPFVEPTLNYTNINNGLGIFAAYATFGQKLN